MDFHNFFEFEIINNHLAVIKLPQMVVSGEEAMNFTALINHLIDMKSTMIVLDLANVQIMNSTGLGMIAGTHNNLSKINTPFFLTNLNAKIEKLFEMTHLNQVIKIEKSLENVLNKLK